MLSDEQFRQFGRDGYIVLRDVIGEEFLAAADEEIDAVVAADPPSEDAAGHHFYFMAPERLPASDAALLKSGALQMAEELVAPLALEYGMGDIQIALNLPPYNQRPGGPHIDGHRPEQAEPRSFTMLAAVYLVDEGEMDSGNLWVWPGSHLVHQQLFTERGVGVLLPVSGHPTMLNPPVVYAEPTPVYARRGDLLLAHFLLGHNIGGNLTSEVRSILYYRLSCRGYGARWSETFLDAFAEYDPVR
jgi:ectoine hydroxylase-related dioxygenase (phytanoyl-CoA dioxygenase family)